MENESGIKQLYLSLKSGNGLNVLDLDEKIVNEIRIKLVDKYNLSTVIDSGKLYSLDEYCADDFMYDDDDMIKNPWCYK